MQGVIFLFFLFFGMVVYLWNIRVTLESRIIEYEKWKDRYGAELEEGMSVFLDNLERPSIVKELEELAGFRKTEHSNAMKSLEEIVQRKELQNSVLAEELKKESVRGVLKAN